MSRGGSVNTLVIRPSNLRKDWEPFAPIRSSTAVLITVLVLHTLPPGFTQSKASDDRILVRSFCRSTFSRGNFSPLN
ncbi:uncharacterized protein MYCGRDRAFT_104607 [Zymoseptoria tritici IPO323]|uniref:Uncharacterized protein n=1 Tax=Zymoseptoria tritici (strain CBS 115943 / IPO323) TaxID=336722 RepID=F9XBG9_ZYMTI|nr:uncharacterized protein MYCGRDRAFT_104607 [Zymoseptoria tritici IPO323]EGP87505.1 hypothetical protein MYCGRDRAFT_104607 [Zymoseptoria tritici IPO323]